MGFTNVRASSRAKAYTRRSPSLVKKIKATANRFAPQPVVDALQKKYHATMRATQSRSGYDFNGFIRRTRRRALGKKTSIYG